MARSCIFCGDESTSLSVEHVWPLWISRLLKGRGYGPFSLDGTRADGPQKSFLSKDIPLTVRAVCQACNNGWLSQLEELAKPTLSRLIQGEKVTLSYDDQLIVGVWITKTVMLTEYVSTFTGQRFFTDQERRRMAEGEELVPPERSVIWLAGYEGESVAVSEVADLTHSTAVTEPAPGVLFTLAIGAFAFQMLCHRRGEDLQEPHVVSMPMRPGPWQRTTVQIWPIRDDEAVWPPYFVLDDGGLIQLRDRWSVPRPNTPLY